MITNRIALYLAGELPPYYQAPLDRLELLVLIKRISKRTSTADLYKVIDSEDFYSMCLNRLEKRDPDGLVLLVKELNVPEDAGGFSPKDMRRVTLEALRDRLSSLESLTSPQERGKLFEPWLRDLFQCFDLKPRLSYSREVDQIDGSFELDGKEYLIEAKWMRTKPGTAVIDIVHGKLNRCLVGTVALVVSMSGYTKPAVKAARGHKDLLLMSKKDLLSVLNGEVELGTIIRQLRRRMADDGLPLLN